MKPSSSEGGRSASSWIRGILALLVATGLLSLVLEASSLDYAPHLRRFSSTAGSTAGERLSTSDDNALQFAMQQRVAIESPEPVETEPVETETEVESEVPAEDLHHLSLLHGACLGNRDAIVSWQFGAPGADQFDSERNEATLIHQDDPQLLEKLRRCPDVDLFLPSEVRGNGYCEDSMAYAKFLQARLLPRWAMDVKVFDPELGRDVDYFELCPKTPVIFFNHYWDNLPGDPRWPADKPVWLMPNIEMWELNEDFFWRVDAVLCKTQVCEERMSKWFEQEGNPRGAKVFYTKHTSSDQAGFARKVLGEEAIAPKDFEQIRFVHTVGGSYWKGTRQVLECWLSRPDLPPLDLYVHKWAYDGMFHGQYATRIANSQITLTTDEVDALEFSKKMAEASFFLCPSVIEGYGHYMNQARAAGGVVVTTDIAPMNELIAGDDMGIKVNARTMKDSKQFLGGGNKGRHALRDVDGMVAQFTGRKLCNAVDKLINETTPEQRAQMGERARLQYHADTKFFAQAMRKLRVLVRETAGVAETENESTAEAVEEKAVDDTPAPGNLRGDPGA